jgi:phosphatidate cytidylyltransferase
MTAFPLQFGLAPVLVTAYLAVLALLVAITIALLALRNHPKVDYPDLMARGRGWWLVMTALALAFACGPAGVLGIFALIALAGTRELLALGAVGRPTAAVALIAVALHFALLAWGPPMAVWVFLPVVAPLLSVATATFDAPPAGFARRAGSTLLALLLGGWSLSQLPALLTNPHLAGGPAGALGVVVYVILLAQLNDVAQFYWGKFVGRGLVAPALSPKKTWGGLLGGIVTVAALAWWLAPALTPLPRDFTPLLGVAIAVGGFLGDLTISALKRDAGVKDTGAWLPGFGGLMDRFDSLIYVAPAIALALTLWPG